MQEQERSHRFGRLEVDPEGRERFSQVEKKGVREGEPLGENSRGEGLEARMRVVGQGGAGSIRGALWAVGVWESLAC